MGLKQETFTFAGCTSGFVSLESLIAQSGMFSFIETGQYLYPSIKFTCSGSITGWSVLSKRSTDNNNTLYPDLQVWRGEGGGAYTRVGSTTLNGGSIQSGGKTGFNIREYPLEPPLEFQTGDIFGIFQPPLDMSYLNVFAHKRLGSTPTVILIETNSAVKPPNSTLNLNNVDSSDSLFAYVHVSVMTGKFVQMTAKIHGDTRGVYNGSYTVVLPSVKPQTALILIIYVAL